MRYPITYSRLLARELRLTTAQQALFLGGTTLHADDLERLNHNISLADQVLIIQNALQLAARPTFGLEIGSRLSLAAHGSLGLLLSASSTLGEAWTALERYHALRLPLVQLSRQFHAEHLELCLTIHHPLDNLGIFLIETLMVTIQRGVELVLGRKLREAHYWFAYPAPSHAAAYADFLHGTMTFAAAQHKVCIPIGLLAQPNPFRDQHLYQQAINQCEQLEQHFKSAQPADWRTRIVAVLRQHPGKLWSLIELASYFNMSSRTLMRHLHAEQTNYQHLLDQELARQALELLHTGQHTVESVGLALGYQDATAFRRAFRRWFGLPPSQYLLKHPQHH